jgi:hypothetical protein
MTEQQEKLISIEYLLDIIEDLLNDKYPYDLSILEQISINVWKKYENELKEAYEKGIKYTDEIISDERFSF